MSENKFNILTSRDWFTLNKLRSHAKSKILLHESEHERNAILRVFTVIKTLINQKEIAELDEIISDLVVDFISHPESLKNDFECSVMDLYNKVTEFRH